MRRASHAAVIAFALAVGALAGPAGATVTSYAKPAPVHANRPTRAIHEPGDSASAVTTQITTPSPLPPGESAAGVTDSGGVFSPWAPTVEVWLSILILTFGCLVLAIEFALLRGARGRLSSEGILRVVGVTTIIIGALFCITAGFSPQQIAPA